MSAVVQLVCPQCRTLNRVPAERNALAAKCGACQAKLFSGQPTEVDASGCERHLAQDGVPVLLDVWAPWCGPCRAMAPMFQRAAALLEPQMRLLKLNSDEAPALSARLGIRSIPTMILFADGRERGRTSGARDAGAIAAWARQALSAA